MRTLLTFCLLCLVSFPILKAQELYKRIDPQMLGERWQTDSEKRKPPFLFTPYKPVYFLFGNYTNNINSTPQSLNPIYQVPDSTPIPLQNTEFKFQISFKFRVLGDIFWGHGDLWAAYTQTSRWQLYNADLSRAFRETNYEPEVILNFRTNYRLLGFKGKIAGVSFNHQSNGRAIPVSRSWNRIIAHVGLERKNTQLVFKGWYRLTDEDDENPQATQYVGKGELLAVQHIKGHDISLLGRTGFNFNKPGGSVQLDWVFPIYEHLRGQVQVFHGYGESLIDYNHKQTTVGLGLNLINWY